LGAEVHVIAVYFKEKWNVSANFSENFDIKLRQNRSLILELPRVATVIAASGGLRSGQV
jgi:hypothetical protein